MYTKNLIDAYKDQMNYVQYKQVAADLGVSQQMLTDVRKGRTFLKETQILMMASAIGEEKETALIGLAMDKSKTYEAQQAWANIAKKYNGLGLSRLTMVCGVFMLWLGDIKTAFAQCVLSILC